MIILGIETSCDETAAGIVTDDRRILANQVYSQTTEHAPHGGVVPEIAARAHVQTIDQMIRSALHQADITVHDLDGIAATCGPGLVGGVMVGMMAAKGLAAAIRQPFYAVNHLAAHVLTARLTDHVPFPYLTLLVSGGHTQLLIAHDIDRFQVLGESLDDACGEAFDKSAKLLGLGYPGGPAVEHHARACPDLTAARARSPFPCPLVGRPGCDFSFSGLKTAVRERITVSSAIDLPDFCASLQATLADILADRVEHAIQVAKEAGCRHIVVAGGVAANQTIRARLGGVAADKGMTLIAPPIKLCTDNGVMIAWAGVEMALRGHTAPLDTAARPRWPLNELQENSS
jgi:N6-L-threonylcarbamoyladenine synthase